MGVRKYKDTDQCIWPGCEEPPKIMWRCVQHDSKWRYDRDKQRAEEMSEDAEFTRRCTKCGIKKDWKKFPVLEGPTVCKDCWFATYHSAPARPVDENIFASVLTYIERTSNRTEEQIKKDRWIDRRSRATRVTMRSR